MTEVEILEKNYEFKLSDIIEELKKAGVKRVGLQLPEGLKTYAPDIMKRIEEETGALCFLSLAPCFGACDLRTEEFKGLGVEKVLHFGHSAIPELEDACSGEGPDTFFVEMRRCFSPEQLDALVQRLALLARKEKATSLLLTSTVQYAHILPELQDKLSPKFQVKLQSGDQRLAHPGQVLGCNFTSASLAQPCADGKPLIPEAELLFFIGDGRFHPLGLSLSTGKKVLALNPFSLKITEHEPEELLKARRAAITMALSAESFGILISTKPGQTRLQLGLEEKKRLEAQGKTALLLFDNELRPESLSYLPVGVLVSTLCPRFALDDGARIRKETGKSVLTPRDLDILLNYLETGDSEAFASSMENYRFDEIRESDQCL